MKSSISLVVVAVARAAATAAPLVIAWIGSIAVVEAVAAQGGRRGQKSRGSGQDEGEQEREEEEEQQQQR